MAGTIVFPSYNNRTFRNGFIKLVAVESDFDQAAVAGSTNKMIEKLTNTSREIAAEHSGSKGYLDNAINNMKIMRHKFGGTTKFVAILPLPLSISDSVSAEYNQSNSAFIDGAYGKIAKMGRKEVSNSAMLDSAVKWISDTAKGSQLSPYLDILKSGMNTAGDYLRSGNHNLVSALNGTSDIARAIANSPAMMALRKPNKADITASFLNTDASLIQLHNEAAAMNGQRQIVFDPGYWQSFQGVNPRNFTLTWDIIPESHEEAVNGLVLCARLKEFSLPQSVSGVELLSPPYWYIDWSTNWLVSQTLYSMLVITNVTTTYAENGEFNGSTTPKMFRISITFTEAKAPTADIYKSGTKFIPVEQGASGGAGK